MTNYENIKLMPVEKLAELLLKKIPRPVSPFLTDEDNEKDGENNGEWKFSEKKDFYETSDHRFFENVEKALEHEIEWLYEEKVRDMVYD